MRSPWSLPAVIDANTGVKQIFTLVEEDEERLQRASGERTEFRRSYSVNSKMETLSWSEQIGYHLTDEVMKQLSDTLLASLMMISDGRPSAAGKRVLKVQGLFPLSERVHERLDNTPLPMRPIMPPEIEEVRGSETTPQSIKKSEATSPAIATLDERMQKKWLQLDAELGIE